MAFVLNSQTQRVHLAKMSNLPKHHGAGPQKRGAQCSCIACIGLRPALGSSAIKVLLCVVCSMANAILQFATHNGIKIRSVSAILCSHE